MKIVLKLLLLNVGTIIYTYAFLNSNWVLAFIAGFMMGIATFI